jgi:hypothetical protein
LNAKAGSLSWLIQGVNGAGVAGQISPLFSKYRSYINKVLKNKIKLKSIVLPRPYISNFFRKIWIYFGVVNMKNMN